MKYIVAALCAAVLLFGWLYRNANNQLFVVKGELATAQAVNVENAQAMAALQHSVETTDKVLADWNQDRTTLAAVRNTARQAIKEAIHANNNESLRAWADTPVPGDAWGLLRKDFNPGTDANDALGASGGAVGELPGSADPGKWN